jgi:hypothetical protein
MLSSKTEFASHEIFISRVTYPSIINFKLNSKKYTLGSEMQPQIMRAQKSEQILMFEIIKTTDMFQISKHSFGFIHVHRKFNLTHFLFYESSVFLFIYFL